MTVLLTVAYVEMGAQTAAWAEEEANRYLARPDGIADLQPDLADDTVAAFPDWTRDRRSRRRHIRKWTVPIAALIATHPVSAAPDRADPPRGHHTRRWPVRQESRPIATPSTAWPGPSAPYARRSEAPMPNTTNESIVAEPLDPTREAEIRSHRDGIADTPWGSFRDLEGQYTVQAGAYITLTEGFALSSNIAHVAGDSETDRYRRATFIARAPSDIDDLLAEVERLRSELADRPTRAEAWREAADVLDRDNSVSAAVHATSKLRRMANAEEGAVHTDRAHWERIASALNSALVAEVPVGIDLDGTITDREDWAVIWHQAMQRWTVAEYDAIERAHTS